jgi:hypothetical protein
MAGMTTTTNVQIGVASTSDLLRRADLAEPGASEMHPYPSVAQQYLFDKCR